MKERQSEINPTFLIKEDRWVISLARLADTSLTQHAFLILEGIEAGKATIYFMDFVGPRWLESLPNSEIGVTRFEKHEAFYADDEKNLLRLIYRGTKRMMVLQPDNQIASKQWYIDQDHAINLINAIEIESKGRSDRQSFNILGKDSVLTGASAFSSNKEKGHSCFSWAKEKLHSIGDSNIQVQGSDMVEFINKIAAITALTLTKTHRLSAETRENKNFYAGLWKNPLLIGGVVVLSAAVAVAATQNSKFPTCNFL